MMYVIAMQVSAYSTKILPRIHEVRIRSEERRGHLTLDRLCLPLPHNISSATLVTIISVIRSLIVPGSLGIECEFECYRDHVQCMPHLQDRLLSLQASIIPAR